MEQREFALIRPLRKGVLAVQVTVSLLLAALMVWDVILSRTPVFSSVYLWAQVAYASHSSLAARIIPRHHRRGMRLMRKNRIAEALAAFEASQRFFERHAWLDRWRAWVVLSASRFSYREMALVNQAYCRVALEDLARARRLYEQILREYPDNFLARDILKLMDLARQQAPG